MDWMNALEVDSSNWAHIAWCDIRTGRPEIHYTNNAFNPSACPPMGESSDPGGIVQDVYMLGEDVYAFGSGFPARLPVNIYVTADRAWTNGDPLPPTMANCGT